MGEDQVLEQMRTAHEAGVSFFDTAEYYGRGQAESVMGNAIQPAG